MGESTFAPFGKGGRVWPSRDAYLKDKANFEKARAKQGIDLGKANDLWFAARGNEREAFSPETMSNLFREKASRRIQYRFMQENRERLLASLQPAKKMPAKKSAGKTAPRKTMRP